MERGHVAVVSCEVDGKVPLGINFDLGQFNVAQEQEKEVSAWRDAELSGDPGKKGDKDSRTTVLDTGVC